jgi:hypothetical protein
VADLSPSAQAVLDAAFETDFEIDFANLDASVKASINKIAAAAIRTAADQVVPVELEDKDLDFSNPDDKAEWYQWSQRQCTRRQLLAIADELEGNS